MTQNKLKRIKNKQRSKNLTKKTVQSQSQPNHLQNLKKKAKKITKANKLRMKKTLKT